MATKTVYIKTALLGGTTNAIDGIDGADLLDGDFAFATISNVLYHYVLDDDSAAAESSPDIIEPDQNPGDKRWILQEPSPATVAANTAKNTNVPIATDPIWTAAGELVIGTGANTAHR